MQTHRFRTIGVDVFIEAALNVELPRTIGRLSLKHVSSRGTVITPSNLNKMLDAGWITARYTISNSSDECDDVAIAEITNALGKSFRWTSLVKLFEGEGVPAFT